MPYSTEWIPNEVFLKHQGVDVYRVYRHDEIDNVRQYNFGMTDQASDDGDGNGEFDVRHLSTWTQQCPCQNQGTDERVIAAIKAAIDSGELSSFGDCQDGSDD